MPGKGQRGSAARRRFAAVASRPDPDLAEAAFLIAAEEYPDLDVDGWMRRLDEIAGQARRRAEGAGGDYDRLRRLLDFLYGDFGLRGNADAYYDPRNSFLNDVLERRLGIPITLAVAAIEIGRRVDVPLRGVSFPGHFLLSPAGHPEIVLDPFDGGRFLTASECADLLDKLTGGHLPFHPRLLRIATARQILQRMLHNLRGIYLEQRDLPRTVGALDRLVLLDPENWLYRRDRGLLLLKYGNLEEGVADLESYLTGEPEAPDRKEVREVIREARDNLTKIH